jgi:hypothetical protein
MMLTKGLAVSDMVARVLVDLSDPNQRRWTSDQIIKFINEGIRQLADGGAFTMTDYLVPTANQAYFATLLEPHRILSVAYNGTLISTISRDAAGYGTATASGKPTNYIPTSDGVHVVPRCASGGTSLSFTGSPAITETEGSQISGDGYNCADNAGTVVFFRDWDGECDSAITSPNNLRVSYSYYPREFESSDICPSRYVDALVIYATWRAFNLSNVAEEVVRAQALIGQWEVFKRRILGDKRPLMLGVVDGPMEVR